MSLFVKQDLDAGVGVFFDGFSKIVIAISVMLTAFSFSSDFISSVVFPGIAVNIALFNFYFWIYGRRLEKKGDSNVTALPSGIIVTKMFLWLNAVMMPTFLYSGDAILTWKVAVLSNILSGLIFIILSPFGKYIKKYIPKPAIFGTLAGIAIVNLGSNVMVKMFDTGMLGIIAIFVFIFLFFGIKTKQSQGILMVALITGLFWIGQKMSVPRLTDAVQGVGVYLPSLHFDFFFGTWDALSRVLPAVIAFSIMDIFTTYMGVEQAIITGNKYDINKTLFMSGVLNCVGGFFGSCFSCGIYWGHTAWNKIGARTGYSLALSLVYIIIGIFSLQGIINAIIPSVAVLPFVLFISLKSIQQAFETNKVEHFPMISIAMMFPICEVIYQQISKVAAGNLASMQNIEVLGYTLMSSGSIINALIISSIMYFVYEKQYFKVSITCALAGVLCFFGLIHSTTIGIGMNLSLCFAYFIGILGGLIITIINKKKGV